MSAKLPNIRIVLLQTYHPGNIGAVARAMKTMGLQELYMVNPKKYPDPEATSRAAGAVDLLESAVLVNSLEEAIADCTQVFATTARQQHSYGRPQRTCEQAVQWIKENPAEKIAIVFGRERMGMSTADINLCQQILYIPGNPEYDVLNMAAAVQIVCYELFKQLSNHVATNEEITDKEAQFATQEDVNRFYQHLQSSLEDSGYLRTKQPSETMQRLRHLFSRAEPSAKEISMLRGVLSSLEKDRKN
ncbi:RNA methyltransferase [Pleionea sp. CnH1-48]|uniref:RNA methyltransferase n=1 Tax=Pleionea sp. CnH1-48 TaxID=2954494 RepID=UPI0020974755|nr:RNA methyltransferase [Pleionea sp. CnH1-48]MCO7224739.1 RNA methyltransferase [Pleionea sp. CnH1-48]